MRPLTAIELLTIWENSGGQSLVARSLNMIRASCSDTDVTDPAGLSIGERDARLFRLRERLFGPDLFNMAECPQCHERLEWVTTMSELQVELSEQKGRMPHYSLEAGPYTIQFRLPNSYDLLTALSHPDCQSNPQKLFFDCIINAQKGSIPCQPDELPDDVLDKLDQRMAEEDPCADIRMLLSCSRCAHGWELPFDIVSFLWVEIDNWARHILQEVATLASAFGWSESEILNMSPQRRKVYLGMI
jgi:hypothetical protein